MRSIVYYSSLLGLLLTSASACTKEEAAPEASFFHVTQEGKAWESAKTTTYKAGNTFYLVSHEAQPTQNLYLGFTVPNLRTPVATLHSLVWTQYTGQQTVLDQFLNTNVPGSSTLQLTRLDTVQKVIEGRFEATLQRSAVYSSQQERMQLTEGLFRLTYRDTILPAHGPAQGLSGR
jgi:hypothetical protein